jgi:archaemetzincin
MAEPAVASLAIVPLDSLSLLRAQDLAARLSQRVSVACRVLEAAPEGAAPLLPGRDQLDADAVLAFLEARAAGVGGIVVGVTPRDMAVPVFSFVFGSARAGGAAALVSLARVDPVFYGLPADDELLARRAVNEMLHELGHVASLQHCQDAACLMRFAGSVEKVDVRGSSFCAGCAARLPRWLREPAGPRYARL